MENDPRPSNLFGRVEYEYHNGNLKTDFTKIIPGFLANENIKNCATANENINGWATNISEIEKMEAMPLISKLKPDQVIAKVASKKEYIFKTW